MANTKLLSSLSNARNLIYNPEGLLMQRIDPVNGTAVNNDVYGPDRWNVLCSANAVTVKRSTDAPIGSRHSMQLQKATASGFMGMCQMLEANESIPLAGQFVTLSVWLKSATLTSARIAVLGWNGTADTITSSIVSSWGSTSTYIANVTELGATNCMVSSSWTQFSVTCLVSNANNLMLFVQSGSSATTSDSLFVSQVQCNPGTVVQPYSRRKDADEVEGCQRYYEKSYLIDTPPGTIVGTGASQYETGFDTTSALNWVKEWAVVKRAIPSVTPYSDGTGTAGQVSRGGTDNVGQVNFQSQSSATIGSSGGTSAHFFRFHFTADAEL